MNLLRSWLFALVQAGATVIFSLLSLLTFSLAPVPRNRLLAAWARLMLWLARVLLGIDYRVEGLDRLPAGPLILLAKHQSAWETLAFQVIFPPLCFVLKKELLRIPFFGWGLAMTSPIAIDRNAGREALRQIEEQGRARLEAGLWVVIFPRALASGPASAASTTSAAPGSPPRPAFR
jgi:1-acyl-sn-glycerol-3-phosphate acyltransferase